ncbi:porin [Pantoea sp. 18069]|uniref:porin n=1 Tax=Pantoea sp. 18069 TaxID=2681415 RepID=UPI00135B7B80|nr:porin [Pantoea sp. 18069]
MKNSLIALAVLAACGAATAQSSVTVFGIVDAGIARLSGSEGHVIGMSNSGQSKSRFGIRGAQDLGGGLSASFHLEGQLHPDTGTGSAPGGGMNFQRRSTVSLTGAFGEVRLGRDHAPTFWNSALFDPFDGIGAAQMDSMLGASRRNNNSVGYFLPRNLGGFHGQVQYAFGENASNAAPATKAGNYFGVRAGYANGPLNVAFASGKLDTGIAPAQGDVTAHNLGVSYTVGMVKPLFQWAQETSKAGTRPEIKQTAWLIGATAYFGAGELRASYSRYDRKNSANDFRKFAVGLGYNLSKRTQLYATHARVINKGLSNVVVGNEGLSTAGLNAAGHNTSGTELGIRHLF